MSNISPELWVSKFIKSATNGKSVSGKTRRAILVVVSLILLVGLINVSITTYDGIKAIPKYKKAKELLELSKRLSHSSYEYHSIFGCYPTGDLSGSQSYETRSVKFNASTWMELGITNPSSFDCGLEEVAYATQSREVRKIITLPAFMVCVVALVAFAWLVTRLTFWIIDADKTKE